MRSRAVLWGALLIAALCAGGYIYLHDPFARDSTEIRSVPLSHSDPTLDRFGDALYLGGLDIPRMGQNIGGLSGLRWDAQSDSLLAITDDARWVTINLAEEDQRIQSLESVTTAPMLGADGEPLSGKGEGDSESLTRSAEGGWLVGFERDHRVVHFPTITSRSQAASLDPVPALAPMDDNSGLETLAGDEDSLFACAERVPQKGRPNCVWDRSGRGPSPFALEAIPAISWNGAVPTDADRTQDGRIFALFRSYSRANGNWVGVSELHPDGARRDVLVLEPERYNVDNFEGLAVREEGGRTFLYLVSDDNFSASQRTLLMKFELAPQGQSSRGQPAPADETRDRSENPARPVAD